ncbi:MAG: adenylate kinase family protein [Methanobacteriaceae archaeon]|jgi:adenylate kinase|nr:adenylate kinase family protein [Methanobacteriaceae archaeon]
MTNQSIFITGTPGVGKTTIANFLFDKLEDNFNVKLIKINDLAIENDLVIDEDFNKQYKIIDIDRLDIVLQKTIDNFFKLEDNCFKLIIVEGHLSHFCSNPDKVIVLRLDPDILKKRLLKRNYSIEKINENLEAEALAICSNESYDIHGIKTNEIDTTSLDLNQILAIFLDIINNKKEYPPGQVDYMDWIIQNF